MTHQTFKPSRNLPSEGAVEVADGRGRILRVSFQRHGDRIAHTVALLTGRRLMPLLASVEGDDQDAWPGSPPLQQLSVENHPGGTRVLLLVGMAGRSHWSLSVETDPNRPAIVFALGCRVKDQPNRLSSRYRTMMSPLSAGDGRALRLDIPESRCGVEILPAGDETLYITASGLEIVSSDNDAAVPRTVQWAYRIALSD